MPKRKMRAGTVTRLNEYGDADQVRLDSGEIIDLPGMWSVNGVIAGKKVCKLFSWRVPRRDESSSRNTSVRSTISHVKRDHHNFHSLQSRTVGTVPTNE